MRVLSLLAAAAVGSAVAAVPNVGTASGPTTSSITGDALENVVTKFGPEDSFPTVIDGSGEAVCAAGVFLGAGIGPTILREVKGENSVDEVGPNGACTENLEISYNAIGYNTQDHFLYAVTDHQNPTDIDHHVVRISKNGCVELVADIGPLDGVPNNKHIAGDVYQGVLWASSKHNFRAITLPVGNSGLSINAWEFDRCTSMNDFAFANAKFNDETGVEAGTAFGFDIDSQTFCSFQSVAGGLGQPSPTQYGNWGVSAQIGDAAKIGGFFLDKDSNVYMYDNDSESNQIFKFSGLAGAVAGTSDLVFEFAIDLGEDMVDANNVDGVACVQAPVEFNQCTSIDKRCCPQVE